MSPADTVRVPRDAFRFCRWSLAVLMWVGALTHWVAPVLFCWIMMAASTVLTVRWSPLILAWRLTVHRFRPSPDEELSVSAMRFGHCFATVLIGLPLLLVSHGSPGMVAFGWRLMVVVAVMKTIGAAVGCPATKLYKCMSGGGACCSVLKDRLRGGKSC